MAEWEGGSTRWEAVSSYQVLEESGDKFRLSDCLCRECPGLAVTWAGGDKERPGLRFFLEEQRGLAVWLGALQVGRKQDKEAGVVCVAIRTRQACQGGGARWAAVSAETRPTTLQQAVWAR